MTKRYQADNTEVGTPLNTVDTFLAAHEGPSHSPLNVIDLDMSHREPQLFGLPDCVTGLSLAHSLCPPTLPKEMDPRSGVSSYLLLSEHKALTNFHQDFTASSVFYFVVKGEKVFYLVRPTDANQKLFDEWLESRDYR